MPTESTNTKEELVETGSALVVSGLTQKDKAVAGTVAAALAAVIGYFSNNIQEDVSQVSTSQAVIVEKMNNFEKSMDDIYTKSAAVAAWERQRDIDAQQDKDRDKLTEKVEALQGRSP